MEKPPTKWKNKILKFLPKAAQATISFQNLPFSPRRNRRPDVRPKPHPNKAFSGPIFPTEARRKFKNFETQEPTSPKVSCMGQIKHKQKILKKKHVSLPKEFKPVSSPRPEKFKKARPAGPDPDMKKKSSGIKKILRGGRKSESSISQAKPQLSESAPKLSQMRRFASSRDTFANFDWTTAQIAPEEDREFYSDEERGFSDGEDDVIIPFSAPILMTGAGLDLEPRKEINLWKRRTMAPPKPLELNMD